MKNKIATVKGTREFYPEDMVLRNYLYENLRAASQSFGYQEWEPGFVWYRLMRANPATTIAIAEWESETLGLAGSEQYRAWMRRAGIMDRLVLETHTGQVVASSD